jgi:hypothetical protein
MNARRNLYSVAVINQTKKDHNNIHQIDKILETSAPQEEKVTNRKINDKYESKRQLLKHIFWHLLPTDVATAKSSWCAPFRSLQ